MCGDVRKSWFERCDEAKMDDGRRGGGSEVNDDIYVLCERRYCGWKLWEGIRQ